MKTINMEYKDMQIEVNDPNLEVITPAAWIVATFCPVDKKYFIQENITEDTILNSQLEGYKPGDIHDIGTTETLQETIRIMYNYYKTRK